MCRILPPDIVTHLRSHEHFEHMQRKTFTTGLPADVNVLGSWWQQYIAHENSDYTGSIWWNHLTGDIYWDHFEYRPPPRVETIYEEDEDKNTNKRATCDGAPDVTEGPRGTPTVSPARLLR